MRALRYPAISLWQPFASLVFASEPWRKRHETRGFALPDNRRGVRHAIHATSAFAPARTISDELHSVCVEAFGSDYRRSLPCGAIIGTVVFLDSAPTESGRWASDADFAAGDWREGRSSWALGEPIPLPVPITANGRQSWFSVELPE